MEKVKLSKEEIKKMMDEGTLVPIEKKDLNKRPGFIDRNAVLISVLAFVGIVLFSYLIVEFVMDVRSVNPLPKLPPDVEMLAQEDVSEDVILRISEFWENGEYETMDNQLAQIPNLYELSVDTERSLAIYRVRLLHYAGKYERAFTLSQIVQSRFVGDREVQLELAWIKGHIYYEQGELLKSMETFRQVASTRNPWREQAAVYVTELRELTDHQNLLEYFIE
jgi:tetratricopeptide (TPR) repeat protein